MLDKDECDTCLIHESALKLRVHQVDPTGRELILYRVQQLRNVMP